MTGLKSVPSHKLLGFIQLTIVSKQKTRGAVISPQDICWNRELVLITLYTVNTELHYLFFITRIVRYLDTKINGFSRLSGLMG